jgi:hypothetical protein
LGEEGDIRQYGAGGYRGKQTGRRQIEAKRRQREQAQTATDARMTGIMTDAVMAIGVGVYWFMTGHLIDGCGLLLVIQSHLHVHRPRCMHEQRQAKQQEDGNQFFHQSGSGYEYKDVMSL